MKKTVLLEVAIKNLDVPVFHYEKYSHTFSVENGKLTIRKRLSSGVGKGRVVAIFSDFMYIIEVCK